MDIGLFYQIQVPKPWTTEREANIYYELLDQVPFAEEMGFSRVWMADHQFRSEWSHSSAPDVTLAALTQRTTQIRLGIAVVVPPIQHPLQIAARVATLDIISKGRVDLGVGRSGYPYQMVAFGTPLSNATGMVDEALEIIPRAWTEQDFSYEGTYYKIPLRQVHPKPLQKPHPPLWLGCSQEDTFRKAGELGLGALAMVGGGPEQLARLIEIYRETIKRPHPAGKLVHNRVSGSTIAFCMENRTEAFQRGAELLDWYREQQRVRDTRVWGEQNAQEVPEDYQWHFRRTTANDAPKQDDVSSMELLQSGRYCVGDPDDCIRYLEQFEATGLDEMMPLFQIGPITHQEVMETLRLFGKHVIPHFRNSEKSPLDTAPTGDG